MKPAVKYDEAWDTFRYDPLTGVIYWKESGGIASDWVKRGIGFADIVRYKGRDYLKNHLVWLLLHGEWPTPEEMPRSKWRSIKAKLPRGVKMEIKYNKRSGLYALITKNKGLVVATNKYDTYENAEISRRNRIAKILSDNAAGKPVRTATARVFRHVELIYHEKHMEWRVCTRRGKKVVSVRKLDPIKYNTEEKRKVILKTIRERCISEDAENYFLTHKIDRYEF